MSAQSIASVWEERVKECASDPARQPSVAHIVDVEVTPWTPHSDDALNAGILQPSRFAAFGKATAFPGSAGSSRTSTSSSTDRLLRRCSADKPPMPPPRLPAATVLEVEEEHVAPSALLRTSASAVPGKDEERSLSRGDAIFRSQLRGSQPFAAPSRGHLVNLSEDEAQREILSLERSLRRMDDDIHVLEETVQRQAKAVGIL